MIDSFVISVYILYNIPETRQPIAVGWSWWSEAGRQQQAGAGAAATDRQWWV